MKELDHKEKRIRDALEMGDYGFLSMFLDVSGDKCKDACDYYISTLFKYHEQIQKTDARQIYRIAVDIEKHVTLIIRNLVHESNRHD